MSIFSDQLKEDMATVFCNSDEFAETVTYKPRGGGTRAIKAVVDRNPPAYKGPSGKIVTPVLAIRVPNSATTGISSAELDTGGDKVSVAKRIGETAEDLPVHVPQNGTTHDAGRLTLELY